MPLQHLTDIYPNVISITKIRQDIDALMDLLEKYPEVHVLKGQDILFKVSRIDSPLNNKQKMQQAVSYMGQIAQKYAGRKNKPSATQWLIQERERIRTKAYYDEHHR